MIAAFTRNSTLASQWQPSASLSAPRRRALVLADRGFFRERGAAGGAKWRQAAKLVAEEGGKFFLNREWPGCVWGDGVGGGAVGEFR
jgi:hypothetical protein